MHPGLPKEIEDILLRMSPEYKQGFADGLHFAEMTFEESLKEIKLLWKDAQT